MTFSSCAEEMSFCMITRQEVKTNLKKAYWRTEVTWLGEWSVYITYARSWYLKGVVHSSSQTETVQKYKILCGGSIAVKNCQKWLTENRHELNFWLFRGGFAKLLPISHVYTVCCPVDDGHVSNVSNTHPTQRFRFAYHSGDTGD